MRYWMFQAIPERYKIDDHIDRMSSDNWLVTRYGDQIRQGDVVFFWQAGGKQAALHGWGIVQSPTPYSTANGDQRVTVSYDVWIKPPIPKSELIGEKPLKEFQLFRAPQGTNFKVTEDEALTLKDKIKQKGFRVP